MEDPSAPFLASAETASSAIDEAVSNPFKEFASDFSIIICSLTKSEKYADGVHLASSSGCVKTTTEKEKNLPRSIHKRYNGPYDTHHEHIVMFRVLFGFFDHLAVHSSLLPDLCLWVAHIVL